MVFEAYRREYELYPFIHTDTDTPLMVGQRDQYEKIWHLLIPPIMTMLDDYEPKYKLESF